MIARVRRTQEESRRNAGCRGASRSTDAVPARPRLKVWVVFSDRVKFGDGRAELLRLVDELGSLKKAVARSGMSYRSAWGYLLGTREGRRDEAPGASASL